MADLHAVAPGVVADHEQGPPPPEFGRPFRSVLWFVPRSVLRWRPRWWLRALLKIAVLAWGWIAIAYAPWGSRWTFPLVLGGGLALVLSPYMVARLTFGELRIRDGYPSMVASWFRALRDSLRSDGPEVTVLITTGERRARRSALQRVRVGAAPEHGAIVESYDWTEGASAVSRSHALDAAATAEFLRGLDARFYRIATGSARGVRRHRSGGLLLEFRRRRIPGLAFAADPRFGVSDLPECRAAHVLAEDGVLATVRPGVGIDRARLGTPEADVLDAIGRHWPSEPCSLPGCEGGVRWPRTGISAGFDVDGRCVLLRVEHPATAHLTCPVPHMEPLRLEPIGGDRRSSALEFEDILRRAWPTTRRDGATIEVPEVGLTADVRGGRAPTRADFHDLIGEHGNVERFGEVVALDVRPLPARGPARLGHPKP